MYDNHQPNVPDKSFSKYVFKNKTHKKYRFARIYVPVCFMIKITKKMFLTSTFLQAMKANALNKKIKINL